MLYHTAKPWAGASITAGFDWKKYGGVAENVLGKIDFGDHTVKEYAPYLHVQQLVLQRFILSAGLRKETNNIFGDITLPKVGLVVHATPSTSIRFSMAKGFRSPTIRELYLFPAPTPDLQPEELWNQEVGLTQWFGQHLKVEAALFKAKGSNLIRLLWPSLVNTGSFNHTGYEASLQWLPVMGCEMTATWSKLDLDDQTMYAPGKKGTVALSIPWRTVRFSLQAQFISDLYGADFYKQPLPDYSTLGISVHWRIRSALEFRVLANNILDTEYETLLGYPMPGRHGRVEWTFTW
jgi:iron complex outermembrane receptor protein